MNNKAQLSSIIYTAIIIIGFFGALILVIYLPNLKYDKSCLDKVGKDYCDWYTSARSETWEYSKPIIFDWGFSCIEHGGTERTGFYEINWNYYFTQEELKKCLNKK